MDSNSIEINLCTFLLLTQNQETDLLESHRCKSNSITSKESKKKKTLCHKAEIKKWKKRKPVGNQRGSRNAGIVKKQKCINQAT